MIRDILLIKEQIDYQSFFNDLTKQEVILDKNKNWSFWLSTNHFEYPKPRSFYSDRYFYSM